MKARNRDGRPGPAVRASRGTTRLFLMADYGPIWPTPPVTGLKESVCDGDASAGQHDATESLPLFADLGTQKSAEFQPGESHRRIRQAAK